MEAKLDETNRALLNTLQTGFPLSTKPFEEIAGRTGITTREVIERVNRLKDSGVIRQIGAIFDSRALGYSSVLVAMKIDPDRLDAAAEIVNRRSGVSHNYARNHPYNLWFTLTAPPGASVQDEARKLSVEAGAEAVLFLPSIRVFKIDVIFDMSGAACELAPRTAPPETKAPQPLSREDKAAVRALQQDLPIRERPFAAIAESVGMVEDQLLRRAQSLLQRRVMRRFGATLRHREAGFAANAMGAWVVTEDRADEAGRIMAGFQAVSHCYQRPTFPDWPYSLFTMIHGRSEQECERAAAAISQATGITDYRLLYTTKEYKKNRVEYFREE